MTTPKPKTEPQRRAPKSGGRESAASPIGRRIVVGIGLLLVAFLLWEVRDVVPSWAAQSVTANVELATGAERDDSRITRAFEAAMQTVAADATLEPLPNQTKIRHTRVTVRAASS